MSGAGNRLIAPMLATPGEPPVEMDGWAAEMKYDGFRLLAGVGGGAHPVLWTRNLNVVTSSYPEVADALTSVFGGRGRIVLDGEVVALSSGGRPSFARLQKRMNTLRPTTALRRQESTRALRSSPGYGSTPSATPGYADRVGTAMKHV